MNEKEDGEDLLNYLGQFITDHKKLVMERVLEKRARFITLVLEDILKAPKTNAVLRTCDCFGIQDTLVSSK